MTSPFIKTTEPTTPIYFVSSSNLKSFKENLGASKARWLDVTGFKAKLGEVEKIANGEGALDCVVFGTGDDEGKGLKSNQGRSAMVHAGLARQLPAGNYHFEGAAADQNLAAIAWGLGAYQFSRYKSMRKDLPKLKLGTGVDEAAIMRAVSGSALVRDLINTPASDMGPDALEVEFGKIAEAGGAHMKVVKGEALLTQNFPMIHAVGRAAEAEPRLLEMNWGNERDPKLTLVGKGVCYDTGGLSIKPTSSMLNMKKDMGGSAHVLGLAQMIMDAKLPVSLQVLVPAVENAISGNAYRPGDVLKTRKGISVEIGNTDAEGRLVLGDALAYGDEKTPDLMIDFATLTGAARVALGPDVSPYYCENAEIVSTLNEAVKNNQDPLWHMPLWHPYESYLNSKIADINHIGGSGFAGSVTAALFLNKFVEQAKAYIHFDVFGWCPENKPWCPVGGEAQGLRAVFELLQKRYC